MLPTVTFTDTLNSWAEAWSAVMFRNTVDSTLLLIVVGLIWMLSRRWISSQLTIGLFSLVLLKLAVPIPLVLPDSVARFWPSPRMAKDFLVGTITRSTSSTKTASAPGRVPRQRSLPMPIPGDPGRSPTDFGPLKTDARREPASSASRAPTTPGRPDAMARPVVGQPERGRRLTTTAILMLTWAAIVAVLIGRLIRTNLSFFLKVRGAADIDPATLPVDWSRLCRSAGAHGPITIVEIEDLAAPAIWGLLRPRILVPRGLLRRMHPQPLAWVLLHELMHIRRGDLWLNLFERLVQITHFFHPAVWVATRVINVHREFACDDAALAVCLDIPRQECGKGLVWVAEQAQAHGATNPVGMTQGLFGSYALLQRRLLRILDTRRVLSSRLSKGATVLLAGLAILTLPYVRAQDEIAGRRVKQETSIVANALQPQAPRSKEVTEDAKGPLRSMEIRVINSRTGRPEPGVTIGPPFGLRNEGTTDAAGRYRLTGRGPDFMTVGFRIQKAGFAPLYVTWDNASAEIPVVIPREYTATIVPASVVGGIVQDEQGEPVAGARVRISFSVRDSQQLNLSHQNDFPTNTDADGRWECDIVPAELGAIMISVRHDDYLVESVRQVRSQSPREFAELRSRSAMFVLKKGLTLNGRVTNSEGNPIAQAQVSRSPRLGQVVSTTDEQGRFELEHVPPGPIEVGIQAKGHVTALQRVVAAPGRAPLEIRLEPGKIVSGRVVDEENKPVAGASIWLELGPPVEAANNPAVAAPSRVRVGPDGQKMVVRAGPSERTIGPPVTSGQDGRFRIEGVPADGGSLIVRLEAHRVTHRFVPSEKDETIILAGRKTRTVRITVTDAESGEPVPAFNVVLRGSMTGRQSATGGRHELTLNMPPSRPGFSPVEIRIEAEGYVPSGLRPVPTDQAEIDLKYQLTKGAAITGVVRAPDGTPAANADITLRGPSQQVQIGGGRLRPNGVYPVVQTSADGRFTFAPRDGPFLVVVAHPSGFGTKVEEAHAGRQNAPIDITLQPWGRVEGVFKIGSQLGRDQKISLFRSRSSEPLKVQYFLDLGTTTDDKGSFVFDRVIPGIVGIYRAVPINSHVSLSAQEIPAFEVKPGETTRLMIGGVGRPVIGHVEIPAELKAKWSFLKPRGQISFSPKPPK